MTEKCKNCGNDTFEKGVQFMQIKKKKSSLHGSALEVSFCTKCGEVSSMKVINPDKVV